MRLPKLKAAAVSVLKDDSAATATEYAVMLALVLTVILTSVTLFGQNLNTEYSDIDTSLFGS